jgi:hypothetical protein
MVEFGPLWLLTKTLRRYSQIDPVMARRAMSSNPVQLEVFRCIYPRTHCGYVFYLELFQHTGICPQTPKRPSIISDISGMWEPDRIASPRDVIAQNGFLMISSGVKPGILCDIHAVIASAQRLPGTV